MAASSLCYSHISFDRVSGKVRGGRFGLGVFRWTVSLLLAALISIDTEQQAPSMDEDDDRDQTPHTLIQSTWGVDKYQVNDTAAIIVGWPRRSRHPPSRMTTGTQPHASWYNALDGPDPEVDKYQVNDTDLANYDTAVVIADLELQALSMDDIDEEHAGPHAQAVKLDEYIILMHGSGADLEDGPLFSVGVIEIDYDDVVTLKMWQGTEEILCASAVLRKH